MSEQDQDQKTEEATPKQRKKFRDEGQIPRSQDASAVVSLTAATAAIIVGWPVISSSLTQCARGLLGGQCGTMNCRRRRRLGAGAGERRDREEESGEERRGKLMRHADSLKNAKAPGAAGPSPPKHMRHVGCSYSPRPCVGSWPPRRHSLGICRSAGWTA